MIMSVNRMEKPEMDKRFSLFIGKYLALGLALMMLLPLTGCPGRAESSIAAGDHDSVCVRPAMWIDLNQLP